MNAESARSDADSGTSPRPPAGATQSGFRHATGLFWQRTMMMLVTQCPGLMSALTPPVVWGTWQTSRYLRENLLENARAILGPQSTLAEQTALGRRTLNNFFQFIIELGRVQSFSPEELLRRISEIDGADAYQQARSLGRGAVLVSAHLGSFEVGLAALREHEPRVHLVFQRDAERAGFERLRSAHRRALDVIEAPIDGGLATWLALRDALAANEVVLMHGDRMMPGHKGARVPLLGREAWLPTGPVRLAIATGAPIVPLFAPRDPDGRVRILLMPPILVDGPNSEDNGLQKAMRQLAWAIEHVIRRFPDQWLMVHRPWCEDPAT